MRRLTTVSLMLATFLLILAQAGIAAPLKAKPKASTDIYHPARVTKTPEPSDAKPFAEHFVVFHISSGDEFSQRLVLNNAQNLANFYGQDKVDIEVVTYGPGLRTLFGENVNSDRIARMADAGITFSACANTMKAMGRKTGSLHPAAKVVPGGVVRILELQEAGWSYIRP